jgi:hypothetical protein
MVIAMIVVALLVALLVVDVVAAAVPVVEVEDGGSVLVDLVCTNILNLMNQNNN